MKSISRSVLLLVAATLAFTQTTWSGPAPDAKKAVVMQTDTEEVPLDIFSMESSYTFESDLNHGGSFGKQWEFQNDFEFTHRFRISGNFYGHVGLAYDRFDFSDTRAPVPIHLQSMATVIGIDYMHGGDLGGFIQLRPGFYTEEHLGIRSFDIPIRAARAFVLQPDRLYLYAGAQWAGLRGGYGVLPILGMIWIPNDQWRIMAIAPEPRIVYSPSKNLDIYLGAELEGGSFRVDHHDNWAPQKLSGAQVDYEAYRVGTGFVWSVAKRVDLDFGAGYTLQRAFKYHRAGENFRTDPAPFLRFEFKAAF
jgi:hypothetical protein